MNRDIRRAYRILGLPAGAPASDVKAAYRDLAQVWHPDRFSHSERLQAKAQQNLKRINEAFQALKDYDPAADPDVDSVLNATMSAILDMGDMLKTSAIKKDRYAQDQPSQKPADPTGSPRNRSSRGHRPVVVGLEEWERTGVLKQDPPRRPIMKWVVVGVGAILVVIITVIAVVPAAQRWLFGP
jgi:hypothetical protein